MPVNGSKTGMGYDKNFFQSEMIGTKLQESFKLQVYIILNPESFCQQPVN